MCGWVQSACEFKPLTSWGQYAANIIVQHEMVTILIGFKGNVLVTSPLKACSPSQKVPEGKPRDCTLILRGLSLLIRASEANDENIVIQGASSAVWHVN